MSKSLKVESRNKYTSGHNKILRREGALPAIIYGGNSDETLPISLDHKTILLSLKDGHRIFDLKIDNGQTEQVIVKEVQHHPVKNDTLLHIDFIKITNKTKITDKIVIEIINDDNCEAIKNGAIMHKLLNDIEVTFSPTDMPSNIQIDISKMELGQTIHLDEVVLPKGVILATAITADNNQGVVSLHAPKAAEDSNSEAIVESAEKETEEK